MSFNGTVFWNRLLGIIPYLGITFLILLISLALSLLLGAVNAKWNLGRNRLLKRIARTYISMMRCVPPIVFLFVVYYGGPYLVYWVTGININGVSAIYFAIVTLSLLHGADFAEMMRSAYQSVDKGQKEAALSIGLTEGQAFRRIIFPQALVPALPNLGNAVVTMLKDGALAYSIGVVDMTGQASYLISMNLGSYVLETYIALALIYWFLSILLQKSFQWMERKLRKGEA